MSFYDTFEEKYKQQWDTVHSIRTLVNKHRPGEEVVKGISAHVSYTLAFRNYLRHTQVISPGIVLASGIDQILDSIKSNKWDTSLPHIPTYEQAIDELKEAKKKEGEKEEKKYKYEANIRRMTFLKNRLERKGRVLVKTLEDPDLVSEFNNRGVDIFDTIPAHQAISGYYTLTHQLYLLNLFAIHLPETTAGLNFLQRSSIETVVAPSLLPLYHHERFDLVYKLPDNLEDVSFDYLEPGTQAPDSKVLSTVKTAGDAVLGAYSNYKSNVVAGLLKHIDDKEALEPVLSRNFYAVWKRISPDAFEGISPTNLKGVYSAAAETEASKAAIRRVSPYIAAYGIGLLSMVGVYLAYKDYEKTGDDIKFMEFSKEIANSISSLSGIAASAYTARNAKVATAFTQIANVASVVTASVDFILSTHGTLDKIFGDPDQVLSSSLKLTSSAIALSSAIYSIAGGAALAGPIGLAVALGAMGIGLLGTYLHREDTYIENYLKFSDFGNRYFENSQNPADVHYGNDKYNQISTYLRMITPCNLWISQHENLLGFDLNTGFDGVGLTFPVGTKIVLKIASKEQSYKTRIFTIKGFNGPDSEHPGIVQSAPGFSEHWHKAQDSNEYVCTRIVFNDSQKKASFMGKYFEAEIHLSGEAIWGLLRTIISKATDIPIHQIPYRAPMVFKVRNLVKTPDEVAKDIRAFMEPPKKQTEKK